MKKTMMIIILVLLFTPFASARWTPPDYSITERNVANISDCMNLSIRVDKETGNFSKGYNFKYCTKIDSDDWTCNCRDNNINGTFSLYVVSSNESERLFQLTLNYTQYLLYGGTTRMLFYDNYELKKRQEPRLILNEEYYDYCSTLPTEKIYVDVIKEVPVEVTKEVVREVTKTISVENTTRIDLLEKELKSKKRNNMLLTLIIVVGVAFIIYSYYKNLLQE